MPDFVLYTLTNRRVISRPAAEPSSDYVLQELVGSEWKDVQTWNNMSDDLAHTHAAQALHAPRY